MDKRKFLFAASFVAASGLFYCLSGFDSLGLLGIAMAVGGAIDFLFIRSSIEGSVASEVYGEPGEDLWEFRSFMLMAGGPIVAMYPIFFR